MHNVLAILVRFWKQENTHMYINSVKVFPSFLVLPKEESNQIFMQIARSLHWYISHFRWVGTGLREAVWALVLRRCPQAAAQASSRISPAIIQANVQAIFRHPRLLPKRKSFLKGKTFTVMLLKRFLCLWAHLKSPSPHRTIKDRGSFSLAYLTVRLLILLFAVFNVLHLQRPLQPFIDF